MYTDSKIINGGKITTAQTFKLKDSQFYIFLVPKNDTVPTIITPNMKLTRSDSLISFPLQVGVWNPVVLDTLVVTSGMITDYDIYYGNE